MRPLNSAVITRKYIHPMIIPASKDFLSIPLIRLKNRIINNVKANRKRIPNRLNILMLSMMSLENK